MKKFDRIDLKETAKIYIQDNKYVRKLFFPVLLANTIVSLLTVLLAGQMFRNMLGGSMFGAVRVPPILMSLVTFNPSGIFVTLFTFSISLKILDVMKNKTEEEHNDKTIKELLPDILFGFQKNIYLK